MAVPKTGTASNGTLLHFSVGAIIERDGKYLLVDRIKVPLGWACLAGHVDEDETFEQALVREIKEESGLTISAYDCVIDEEVLWNACGYAPAHWWRVYRCTIDGDPIIKDDEAKDMGWFSAAELETMELEAVWRYWFQKLKIL